MDRNVAKIIGKQICDAAKDESDNVEVMIQAEKLEKKRLLLEKQYAYVYMRNYMANNIEDHAVWRRIVDRRFSA